MEKASSPLPSFFIHQEYILAAFKDGSFIRYASGKTHAEAHDKLGSNPSTISLNDAESHHLRKFWLSL